MKTTCEPKSLIVGGRAWLFVPLVAIFAGCIGESREFQDDGAADANDWVASMWGANQRLTLLDGSEPINYAVNYGDQYLYLFSLPMGRFVLPGTTGVEVTVEYQGQVPPSSFRVSWRGASAVYSAAVPATVDVPMFIDVPANETDVPLAKQSMWWFALHDERDLPVALGSSLAGHEFRLKVEAVRGSALPTYGASGDAWNGQDVIQLVTEEAGQAQTGVVIVDAVGYTNVGGTNGWPTQGIIPPDASRLVGTLHYASAGIDARPNLGAWFGEWQAMQMTKDSSTEREFTLELTPAMTDSPYQRHTAWLFITDYLQSDTDAYPASASNVSVYLSLRAER